MSAAVKLVDAAGRHRREARRKRETLSGLATIAQRAWRMFGVTDSSKFRVYPDRAWSVAPLLLTSLQALLARSDGNPARTEAACQAIIDALRILQAANRPFYEADRLAAEAKVAP